MKKAIPFLLASLVLLLAAYPAKASVSAYSSIEGESYDVDSSKGVSASWENDGTQTLGWINDGDYACYKSVNFAYGVGKLWIRYSQRITPSTEINFRLDKPNGTSVLTITTSRTGSAWTDFVTKEVKFKKEVSGIHDVYVTFKSLEPRETLIHLDWFKFGASDSVNTSLPPKGLEVTDGDGVTYVVLKDQKTLEVKSIPKTMELWYMKNTLNLSSSTTTVTMKITSVASNAAKNRKKLKVVYFGTNVKTVAKNAFKGCTKLNTVIFQGTAAKKNVKTSAFYDIKKKATFYVPKKNLSYFKSAFKADKKTKAKSFKFLKYAPVG